MEQAKQHVANEKNTEGVETENQETILPQSTHSSKEFTTIKFDKEHKGNIAKYPKLRESMQSLLQGAIRYPKTAKSGNAPLHTEYNSIEKEKLKTALTSLLVIAK